jgi:hypothetical protein
MVPTRFIKLIPCIGSIRRFFGQIHSYTGNILSAASPVILSAATPVILSAATPVILSAATPVILSAATPVILSAAKDLIHHQACLHPSQNVFS